MSSTSLVLTDAATGTVNHGYYYVSTSNVFTYDVCMFNNHVFLNPTWNTWRRVAEWLAHSTAKQKVAGSNPTRASGCKTPSVHPAVKWVPDLIQGRKGSGRRGMGSAFHAVP